MILTQHVLEVRNLIQTAATNGGTVTYPRLIRIFPEDTPLHDVSDTLEAACAELADWETAIYSVVMSKKGTGLPGDGFFSIFQNHRDAEYRRIAGDADLQSLSHEQRQQMVQLERAVVYAHART